MSSKTYYECLDEITDDDLFEGLLGYGLFADKIPNFLSSKDFFEFCKNKNPQFKQKEFLYIKYENMRNINVPRLLAIPNPFAYYKQCKILQDYWKNIKNHFKDKTANNEYKVSRIHIRKRLNTKSIFEMNYKTYKKDGNPEQKIIIGKKYLVKADISNCFPSIYTHSISWALVGKQTAKQNQHNKLKPYNKIDERTRWLNNNETHGLLIGPHTSNLISEIILVAVDSEISKNYEYIRNIDDYSCYAETKEKAEQFLIDLSQELKKFGLSLNHKKTEIIKLPIPFNNEWTRKLNLIKLETYDNKRLNYKTVALLMDTAIELMKQNKDNAAILNYTIKILLKYDMSLNAKNYFIDTVHHLVLVYPYLILSLESILDRKFFADDDKIKQISNDIFELGLKTKNYEALSYAIYFSLKYNVKLDHKILIKEIEKQTDCIFMLLCYLYDKKRNNRKKILKYIKLAEDFIVSNNGSKGNKGNKILNDEFWLFAYEILRREKPSALNKCNDWKNIKNSNISFIAPDFI